MNFQNLLSSGGMGGNNYNTISPNIENDINENNTRFELWLSCSRGGIKYVSILLDIFKYILLSLSILTVVWIIIIALGLLCVYFNMCFEYCMVLIVGRTEYQETFPTCSDSKYNGNNCYTTTSYYCRQNQYQ
jgi:hypothetical protein